MDELRGARRRFKALSEGRYVPKELSLEEAKKRLRQSDPGIDVSEALTALNQGDLERAAAALVHQALLPETIAFFAPLIAKGLESFVILGETDDERSRSR